MGSYGRPKWSISVQHHRSPSNPKHEEQETPRDFICPISGSLMADPVVVSSGHSFERVSVQVCREFRFSPKLEDGSRADFSNFFDNRTMKSTILKWCDRSDMAHPQPPDRSSVERIVRSLMEEERPKPHVRDSSLLRNMPEKPALKQVYADSVLEPRPYQLYGESPAGCSSPGSSLPFTTRPSCYSSSTSSAEFNSDESGEQLLLKLKSSDMFDKEEGTDSLRRITRSDVEARITLCTPPLLSALKTLVTSTFPRVQINAIASLVNLSLQNPNKAKIVRSGFIPVLIGILGESADEAVEHAIGALFSLALEDENRTAIAALGALPYLMQALRSEREQTRNDSALCLYNLTFVKSNRVKLVKLGAVPTLLSIVKSGNSTNRALLILCNLAVCPEGISALLDANAVSSLVQMLRENELDTELTREYCVSVLYGLSHGGLRFKGLAREVRAAEVLRAVEARGTERARDKARKILHRMRGLEEDDDGAGRELQVDSGGLSWTKHRVGGMSTDLYQHNTTNF